MTGKKQQKSHGLADWLTDQDRAAGFDLWGDDHEIYVSLRGCLIGAFSTSGITMESLREFLDAKLSALQRGNL